MYVLNQHLGYRYYPIPMSSHTKNIDILGLLLTIGLLLGRKKKKPKIKQNELFCLRYSYSGALLLENKSLLIETPISGIVLVVRGWTRVSTSALLTFGLEESLL